ncbi:MAG: nucleotidyltransferase domain-containing protein [Bacteroidetes bacterium]|nr:nucleotidyltransferase domain-containing protein [Bacteroidota bacterium]
MKPEYLTILKNILNETVPKEEYIVFMFGSRVAKNNHVRSDIDIGLWGNTTLSSSLRFTLEEKIENSIIPYKVELIDFSSVGEYFKKQALQHIELWNCPKNLAPILKIS